MNESLKRDLKNMEDAALLIGEKSDIWQNRIIYWMAVAIFHILTWILRKEGRGNGRNGKGS